MSGLETAAVAAVSRLAGTHNMGAAAADPGSAAAVAAVVVVVVDVAHSGTRPPLGRLSEQQTESLVSAGPAAELPVR